MSFKNIDDLLAELNDIQTFQQETFKNQSEDLWNSISKDDQLKLFCAVIKRLSEAELEENKSYRGVLYDKFNFDLNSYSVAQNSGFLELHNSIYTKEQLYNIFKKYFEEKNINFDEKDIKEFIFNN
jgi:hypothetical protein